MVYDNQPHIERLNHTTLLIHFANAASEDSVRRVADCSDFLLKHDNGSIVNSVPASTSLMLEINDHVTKYSLAEERIAKQLKEFLVVATREQHFVGIVHDIPALYHPDVAPDLIPLANHHKLSVEEIIQRHSQVTYTVFTIGFLPGFAYLGDVDEHLRMPRQQQPRTCVAARSIGIAEHQTGIYPRQSPGGWNIIARSAINPLQDIGASNNGNSLCLFSVGDKVRFKAVSASEFSQQEHR